MIERYSSHDSSRTTLYGVLRFELLFREAICVCVMIQRRRSRLAAEAALFDSGELNMKISKNTVVVPKHGACFDLICQLLRASTPGRPDRGESGRASCRAAMKMRKR